MKESFSTSTSAGQLLAQIAVAEVIQRERLARDNGVWEEMASCYHTDSSVDVSWFRGSGADFVEQTKRIAEQARSTRPEAINFHGLGSAVVTVKHDRATAETPCSLHSFHQLEDAEVCVQAFVRLLWRARRAGDSWLIAGLRVIYVRDLLLACQPGQVPALDEIKLRQFRPSYRFSAYSLDHLGLSPRNDLPGVDRPDTVTALRAEEINWLECA